MNPSRTTSHSDALQRTHGMSEPDYMDWLADKIPAYGDYAKEAAQVLRRHANRLRAAPSSSEARASRIELCHICNAQLDVSGKCPNSWSSRHRPAEVNDTAKQWAEVAIAMLDELRQDYAPGKLKDTDGVKAIRKLRSARSETAQPPASEAWVLADELERFANGDKTVIVSPQYARKVAAALRADGGCSKVWAVESKTSLILFATMEAAYAYMARFPTSVGGGMTITPLPVLAAAPSPSVNDNEAGGKR